MSPPSSQSTLATVSSCSSTAMESHPRQMSSERLNIRMSKLFCITRTGVNWCTDFFLVVERAERSREHCCNPGAACVHANDIFFFAFAFFCFLSRGGIVPVPLSAVESVHKDLKCMRQFTSVCIVYHNCLDI